VTEENKCCKRRKGIGGTIFIATLLIGLGFTFLVGWGVPGILMTCGAAFLLSGIIKFISNE